MATLLKPRAVSPEPIPAVDQFERIRCPDCGHADPAPEGAALILSLEAPCPRCGGRRCEFVASADSLRRVASGPPPTGRRPRASGRPACFSRGDMAKVFVITGPSGVGKGTLISALLQRLPDLQLSISATTREPREGEEDGRDYHFLSAAEFERRMEADDFLEFATYSGNRYGTLRSEVERSLNADGRSVVLEIEVQGAQQVRAAMPDSVQIFIAPPGPDHLRARLEGRGTDSADAIDSRLETAELELAAQGDFDHRIVNDDLERASSELEEIVRAELGLPLDSAAE